MTAFIKAWAYAAGGRDLRIDFLRGFCLLVMMIDHMEGQSYLYALTGKGNFYLSAAEGFYLISGLTLGLVVARAGLIQAVGRTLSRALVIYRTAVLMAFGFALVSHLGYSVWADKWEGRVLGEYVPQVLTLGTGFSGSQILSLYVLFMLLAPLALWFLYQRKPWHVLGASAALYILAQFNPGAVNPMIQSLFLPASWQLLFFFGLTIGFNFVALSRWWAGRPLLRGVLGAAVVGLATALLVGFVLGHKLYPGLSLGEENQFVLTPLRLALSALFIQAFFLLTTWLWRPLSAALGWLLIPLGSASLWTFVGHMVVIAVLWNVDLLPQALFDQNPVLAGTLEQALGILAIWVSITAYRRVRLMLGAPKVQARQVTAEP
ncbi:MAG: OpgC domain-containing protein [Meiothermus sp.]|nr:OpgC domain-containing protein [Meiothermus sp.]